MTSDDDAMLAAVIGGFAGAMLASPSQEDKQLLANAKYALQEMRRRELSLGLLPPLAKLRTDSLAYNIFIEAYNMYLHGFFRAAAVFSTAVLEHLLGKKYGKGNFVELIEKAHKEGIYRQGETHYLHGLRIDRNSFLHDITREVREEDARVTLSLTMRLIDKVLI